MIKIFKYIYVFFYKTHRQRYFWAIVVSGAENDA